MPWSHGRSQADTPLQLVAFAGPKVMFRYRTHWPKHLALGIGVMVSAFAAAVLAAWFFHYVPLIQISPGMPPLTRQGALSELLLGLALACLAAGRRRAAALFATIVIILAGLVGFGYILGRDFAIDQLLGGDYLYSVSPPGSISPVATFCYLSAGLALLLMSIPRLAGYGSAIAGMISSVLIAMSLTMFLAYLLGQNSVYVWGRVRRISIQATVVLVFLGAGTMVLALQESRTRKLMPRWLPLALGLGLSASALGVWQALMFHEERQFPLLWHIILAGGILGALLVAIVVALAQKAMEGKAAFERLFEASPDSLVVIDPAGRVVGANGSMAGIFGYTRDEILGTPVEWLVPIPRPDLRSVYQGSYCAAPGTRPMGKGLELNARRKDGSEFPVEVTLNRLQSKGELQVLAAVRDITERKHAEEELKSLQQRLALALAAGQMGAWDLDLIADRAWRSLEHDRIFGYTELLPTWSAEIFFRHVFAEDRKSVQRAFAEAYKSGRLQFECRITRADNILRWISAEGSVVYNRQHTPVRMLGVVKDITERKHAEEALRESEERFRGIFETSPFAIGLIQLDYRLAKVNPALCRMSGYSEAELMALGPFELTHPDDREASRVLTQRLFKGEIPFYQMEKRYVKKNGEIMWAAMTATVIRDPQGRALFGLIMVADITERKRAEEELTTLSQRLSQAIRFASMSVWEWEPRTNCFVWDDVAFEIAGIPKIVPLPYEQWARLVYAEDLPKAAAALQRVMSQKTQESADFRVIRPDGDMRYLYAAGGPVLDQQGDVARVVGIAVDITERKRAEEELATLNQRLSLAARSASMGVWEWNLRTDIPIWDDRMFEILGIAKKAKVTRRDWTSRIHPEDLAAVEERLATAASGKAQYEVDFRIIRPDGALRHVSAAGGAVMDNGGNVTSVVGTLLDITERKMAHQKLAEQAALLDLAHDAIFVRDLERRITFWSRGAEDTYGWTANEALRRVADELLQTRFPIPVEEVEAQVRMQGGWEGELEHITRDGRNLQMASRWSLLRDERGAPVATLEINRDITARKQLEQDLEAARERAITSARLSALGMMAGGVAHEINNPLSIIHAMASDLVDMVQEKGAAPPQAVARKGTVIRETAERIAKIVKSLRQISREGSSDLFHPTPVAKILAETLEICRAKFEANGVLLLLPQAIPDVSVFCREVQIAQALLNLLQNAFDAALEQEGERWVRLEVEPHDGLVTISVIDSGPGIPSQLRPRIGEPFFTTKPVGKGTGLGLSLSKTIAEDHGGSLECDEDHGHTRFSLVLPRAREARVA